MAYTISGPERASARGRTGHAVRAPAVIYGEVEAFSPVAKLVLLGPGVRLPVAARAHWFLAELPLLGRYEHWRLVAYSRVGTVLGRIYF